MARRKRGRDVHGWVLIDKSIGMGSTQAVSKLRWLFGANKAGHAGTLDPLASGMLPIALGDATKTIPYIQDGRKTYRFTVKWGEATTTDDLEGSVVATSAFRPEQVQIEAALADFTGTISQIPPQFSALKINGQRAYDLARSGQAVELKSRNVEIHDLVLLEAADEDHAHFEVCCGKGTYIRALARDLAQALGTEGHVSALRRLSVGPFAENQMISLEILEEMRHMDGAEAKLAEVLQPIETALDDIPALALTAAEAVRLKNGQAVLLRGQNAPIFLDEAYATANGSLVALGHVQEGRFVPKRVFNQAG